MQSGELHVPIPIYCETSQFITESPIHANILAVGYLMNASTLNMGSPIYANVLAVGHPI
jgi:hypothetical protein